MSLMGLPENNVNFKQLLNAVEIPGYDLNKLVYEIKSICIPTRVPDTISSNYFDGVTGAKGIGVSDIVINFIREL